ncbi:deoxyribose-phosphate aldolase [Candidatus Sumerlaeota bacterium]|nr:deoxyribose-phosphate aldolase [Candidatus Sumerlaeota bacterium]
MGSRDAKPDNRELAPFIDHTLLKSNATDKEIEDLCKEAMEYEFASVCINSAYVPLASRLLKDSGIKVCTVVGFPLGAMSPESKAFETRDAVSKGADEIDMVINVGKLKSRDYEYVFRDIESVVRAAQGRCVKVILETASLSDEEKVAGCILAKAASAQFVKTSTGFGKGGATVQDVALMRKVVGSQMGVKAAGGIRTAQSAREMLSAGATRIGASASVAIVREKA